MARKYESGDVHAPVEDVEVPLGLKVLVILMLLVLAGAVVTLVLTANQLGLLSLGS